MGKWMIITGVVLLMAGILVYYVPGIFNWFGKLPGDIRIENDSSKFFLPVTSMILISIILTLIVNIIRYFMK